MTTESPKAFAYSPQSIELQHRFGTKAHAASLARWPGAQLAVRVRITSLLTNCPRYIPKFQRIESSRYVPDAQTGAQPLPGWKRIDSLQPVLSAQDREQVQQAGDTLTGKQWTALVKTGDRNA